MRDERFRELDRAIEREHEAHRCREEMERRFGLRFRRFRMRDPLPIRSLSRNRLLEIALNCERGWAEK